MEIKFYKIEGGAAIDKASEFLKVRDNARNQYEKIFEEVGSLKSYRERKSKLCAFCFDEEPNSKKWKWVGGGYYPKQNTKFGKDLHKRLESITVIDEIEILKAANRADKILVIGSGYDTYRVGLTILPKTEIEAPCLLLSVPCSKEFGEWVAPTEAVEIELWESEKMISDYNKAIDG